MNQLIGQSFVDFESTLEEYPLSIRFEGNETKGLHYKIKGGAKLVAITQTLWGGSNTAYMTHGTLVNSIPIDTDPGYSSIDWNPTKIDLSFKEQQGLPSMSNNY